MCNLYRMTKARAEVAGWFKAVDDAGGANFADEVYPGYPGLVVADGALRPMNWGFPLAMKGAKGQPLKPRPVNNARTDKLSSAFWRDSFAKRRCLIPLTAWAEAEGEKGTKTRTWFSLPDEEMFAVAGIWRDSDEWGAVYSMVMTEACIHVAGVHDRMPVILSPATQPAWTDGSPDEARALCVPYSGPMVMCPTDEPWVARRA